MLSYDRATGIDISASFPEEGTTLVRVHKVLVATGIMMDPELNLTDGLPTGGHVTIFLVVGASVLIVGWLVSPKASLFDGEKAGRRVGGKVVL